MKNILIVIAFTLFYSANSFGQLKTDSILVRSNCEQCVDRVEAVVNSLTGVVSSKLNVNTEILIVTYESKTIANIAIQQAIVKSGHDTKDLRAPDKAYKSLPACCKYERESIKTESSKFVTLMFKIEGMTCDQGCAKGIETAIYKQNGVKLSEVNYETKKAKVIFDSSKITQEKIVAIVENFKPDNGEKNTYKVLLLN